MHIEGGRTKVARHGSPGAQPAALRGEEVLQAARRRLSGSSTISMQRRPSIKMFGNWLALSVCRPAEMHTKNITKKNI